VHDAVDLRSPSAGSTSIARRLPRLERNSPLGFNWSFSYDIAVAAGSGGGLALFDGHGRVDEFVQQLDGSFAFPGIPMRGVLNLDQSYSFTFPDAGKWNLRALDGSAAQGKISSIVDRNGNAITFGYDVLGRLVTITDTLARNLTLAYTADGHIAM
jgi:YD repeat-containing protein